MNALMEAKQLYADNGLNFEQDLGYYLTNGYVISHPDKFIMARKIDADKGDSIWHPDSPNCWYIHLAVGRNAIKWWYQQSVNELPLPFVAWRRFKDKGNPLKIFKASTFSRFL